MVWGKKNLRNMVNAMLVACCCSIIFLLAVGDAAADADKNSVNLPDVVVTSDRYYGGVMGNKASVGNMLGEKNAMDLPINTNTLGEAAMTTFAAPGQQLIDAISVSPLVRRRQDVLVIRGFYTPSRYVKINGVGGMLGDFQTSGNFIERIGVVAGPDLVYAGSSTAGMAGGGTVSLVSKRAKETPTKNLKLTFSGKSNLTESVDYGRRFGKNNAYGVRINALHQAGGTSVYDEKLASQNIFINFDRTTQNSSFNLLAGYEHVKHNGGNRSFRNDVVDYVPTPTDGQNNIYPGWQYNEHSSKMVTLNYDQKLAYGVSVFMNAGASEYHKPTSMDIGFSGNKILLLNPDGSFDGDFEYTIRRSASKSQKNYIGGGLRWEFKNDYLNNMILVCADRSAQKGWKGSKSSSDLIEGNIYEHNTWQHLDMPKSSLTLNDKATAKGVSVVDTIKFFDDKLIILGGVHHHNYQPYRHDGTGWVKKDKFKASVPTYGLLYKFTPQFAIYANHSETFHKGKRVGSDYKNAGELLDPYILTNNEVGLKYQTDKQMHALAVYKSKNPKYAVETDDGYLRYNGGREFKGIEYTYAGRIATKWDVFGGVSYNNMVTYNTGRFYDGNRQSGMPRLYGSLGFTYHANETWDFIGRYMYTSTAPNDAESSSRRKKKVPAQSRIDAGFRYKTALYGKPVTFQAMCFNVLNNKYWYTDSMGSSIRAAEPRRFAVTAAIDF